MRFSGTTYTPRRWSERLSLIRNRDFTSVDKDRARRVVQIRCWSLLAWGRRRSRGCAVVVLVLPTMVPDGQEQSVAKKTTTLINEHIYYVSA